MFLKCGSVYLNPSLIAHARWQEYSNLPSALYVHLSDGKHEEFTGVEAEAVRIWLNERSEDLVASIREEEAPVNHGKWLCEQGEHVWGLDWYCTRPGCNVFRRDWEREQAD